MFENEYTLKKLYEVYHEELERIAYENQLKLDNCSKNKYLVNLMKLIK